ncbi:reverse transcriptase domain-containing protein [Tanacetum coccineum]|uniref:Reverse transcriptase domain-containing protein n=1 Tax=Tanacetum coccineum TaxID=301880 RepID=A0ABQ5HSB2_9ASTR
MMAIFHDMIEKTMEVFMDDLSVFGDSFDSCLSNLEKMLKWCEDTNLVLNWEKCHFMCKEGNCVRHKIQRRIEVESAKVDVIAKLPHPATVKGTLKKKLTEAPILVVPDWNLPFELMCDASDFAIGAVLGQRKMKHFQPIHYASKTMTEAQIHYTTTEKEMLVVVYAFEKVIWYRAFSFPRIGKEALVISSLPMKDPPGAFHSAMLTARKALKHANFDLKTAGDHRKLQLNELNELRDQAYENSLIYKERTKKLHDSKIKNRIFNVGDRVLLFNSRLKIFSGKLKKLFHFQKVVLVHPEQHPLLETLSYKVVVEAVRILQKSQENGQNQTNTDTGKGRAHKNRENAIKGCVLMQRGKVENATAEILRGLDQLMERKEGGCMYLLWVSLIGDVRTLTMDEARASRYLLDEIQSVALSLLETESPIRIAKYSDCFVDDDVRTSIKSQDEISLRRGYCDNCALSRMTKVIKGEFEKIKDIKVEDDLLACESPLEVFNCEVSRLSKMDDDLFTYEVEIANIPCDLRVDDDSEHEADDMGFDPSDIAFTEWLGSKFFNYKTMDHYTMKALWIYWIRGDDEVELTNEEFSDNEDEIDEVFRIDTNIFDYETPICLAFNKFNYLLKVDPDLLTKDIMGFKTYDDYKDDWIYEWNKDVPWVDEKPWTDTGVWKEPKPVIHTCNPFNYKTGCSEWPTCSWMNDGYCNGGNIPGTLLLKIQLIIKITSGTSFGR